MSIGLITALLFGSMVAVIFLGLPLAFTIGGIAVLFIFFLLGEGSLYMVVQNVYGQLNNFIFVALPLFIFMGNMLERSGIADDLYQMFYEWMGQLRGGLAMGTVIICTLFAAMAGISGAATVTMGVVALPSMLKRGYNKQIAIGSIAAGGALGVLIPPSTTFILFGAFSGESIGRLFAGGVFPGLLLSALFCAYIGMRSFFQKELAPSIPKEEAVNWKRRMRSLRAVVLPITLIFAVLGSIFSGIATPSEAAAIGALGSVVCSAIYRKLTFRNIWEASYRTLRNTSMVMWIVIAATVLTALYTSVGAMDLIRNFLIGLPVSPWVILIGIQLSFFVMGMFLDPAGIIMISVPIFVPVIRDLGFDAIWFGVLFVVNMEMAYLTPPYGVNLFYLRGVAPQGVTMGDIYKSIIPFVLLQAIGLIVTMLFPQIALWLPNRIFGVIPGR